jgi:hypothetical protein
MIPSRRVSHISNNVKEPDNSTDVAHLEHEINKDQSSQAPSDKALPTTLVEEEQNLDTEEPPIPQTLTQQGNPRKTKKE